MTTPLTSTQRSRLAWVGATVLVVGFAALVVCLRDDAAPVTDDVATAERAPLAMPAGQAAPPCIHEVCSDRPARLRCNHWSGSSCDGFDINYEHHCRCDTWGTVATDGGAP